MSDINKLELKNEKVKLRKISDYINSCISRVKDEIELIVVIKRKRKLFSNKYRRATVSICDVYSRDIIITLNQLLDQDVNTSSLFSLVSKIKKNKKQKDYKDRLKEIKKKLNALVQIRNNQVGHFNTEKNVEENGYFHIHRGGYIMRPRDTRKNLKELEEFFWDIKEELKINGVLIYFEGNLAQTFETLIRKSI